MRPRLRLLALAAIAAAGAAACGSSDAASPPTPVTVGGVGALPGTLPPVTAATSDRDGGTPTVPAADGSRPTDQPPDDTAARELDETRPVGRIVDGNRVLVIGDSILAAVSERYGDQLCARLVPRGWVVEVDAEVSRRVEFGRQVLEHHGDETWDASVVMLGNNYEGDPEAFAAELDRLLDELAPRPVVLLTVTRFEPEQDEVNYVLAAMADARDGVRLLDWAARTADDTPGAEDLLAGDGLHLSEEGREVLAAMVAAELGSTPSGSQGECVRSPFRDDDGGSIPAATDDDADEPADDTVDGTDGDG